MKTDYKQEIQSNIGQAARHKEIERSLRISHSSQDRSAHVIDQISYDAQKIDPEICHRISKDLFGSTHGPDCSRSENLTDH